MLRSHLRCRSPSLIPSFALFLLLVLLLLLSSLDLFPLFLLYSLVPLLLLALSSPFSVSQRWASKDHRGPVARGAPFPGTTPRSSPGPRRGWPHGVTGHSGARFESPPRRKKPCRLPVARMPQPATLQPRAAPSRDGRSRPRAPCAPRTPVGTYRVDPYPYQRLCTKRVRRSRDGSPPQIGARILPVRRG